MIQHESPISGIAAFKNDYIATAGYDNQVILWDAKTNTSLAVGRHDHLANQCEFSHCGRYLLSTSSDYTARLWSLPQMQLIAMFGDHEDDVETAIFHRTKKLIVTASRDKIVRLFDFQGQLLKKFTYHDRDVSAVAWLDDDILLSSSDDGTVRKLNINTAEQLSVIDLGGIETDTLAIGKNGVIFAGNDAGNIVIIIDTVVTLLPAHKAGIKRLCYSATQNKLVSLSYDRNMIIWEVSDDNKLTQITTATYPNCVWARSCAFLGDNKLAIATFGSCYAIFDYKNNIWHIDHVKATHGINAVLRKQEVIYSIGDAGTVYVNGLPQRTLSGLCNFLVSFADHVICGGQTGELYNALTGEVIYQHNSPLNCAATYYNGEQQHVIIGAYTGEGIVLGFNDDNKIQVITTIKLHNNAVKGIATDDNFIFSVCADYNAAFHDINTLQLIKICNNAHDKVANACASLGHNKFISSSRDLKLRIFSLTDIATFETKHKNSIKCLAVSEDKKFIASADYHGNVFVYDDAIQIIANYRPTTAGLSSIIAGQNNHEFIVSSYNGKLYPVRF